MLAERRLGVLADLIGYGPLAFGGRMEADERAKPFGTYQGDGEVTKLRHCRSGCGPCFSARRIVSAMDGETRDEIAAAAAAHRELGRGYDEAVAEALVERIGAEIDKRIDARLGVSPRRSRSEVETSPVSRHQAMWTGAVIGAGITGVAAMFAEASHSPHLWAVAIWIIVVAIAGLSPAVARRYRSQSQS